MNSLRKAAPYLMALALGCTEKEQQAAHPPAPVEQTAAQKCDNVRARFRRAVFATISGVAEASCTDIHGTIGTAREAFREIGKICSTPPSGDDRNDLREARDAAASVCPGAGGLDVPRGSQNEVNRKFRVKSNPRDCDALLDEVGRAAEMVFQTPEDATDDECKRGRQILTDAEQLFDKKFGLCAPPHNDISTVRGMGDSMEFQLSGAEAFLDGNCPKN